LQLAPRRTYPKTRKKGRSTGSNAKGVKRNGPELDYGVSYSEYGRENAEVLVETATVIVCGSLGLDTSGESIPYIASWAEANDSRRSASTPRASMRSRARYVRTQGSSVRAHKSASLTGWGMWSLRAARVIALLRNRNEVVHLPQSSHPTPPDAIGSDVRLQCGP
jgi:hypothetical protein